MLEIRNSSPFPALLVPGLDKHGADQVTFVLKATFDLSWKSPQPTVSERQLPFVLGDAYWGEPGRSSVRCESEVGPAKGGTDVVLVGHARAPRPVSEVEVTLDVGPLHKAVRVTGDRAWFRAVGDWKASEPAPFQEMPLIFERAFGGRAPEGDAFEPRNPVGAGITSEKAIEGVRLPNLEDPRELVRAPSDRPSPAGFGFVARDWQPRLALAGTYDEAWRRERCPFLPLDFDERHFHAAPHDLHAPRALKGGEPARITHVSEVGDVAFDVPSWSFDVTMSVKGERTDHRPMLDTLLIEPDERRIVALYRFTIPCPRSFLHIDYVRVRERTAA
jgi:hypothetical protein